jgi:ATP-dependent DNA helicase RecQ
VVAMLAELGELEQDDAGQLALVRGGIDEQTLTELAARYETRMGRDREKLDAMIAYAQSALCRWQLILRQFDESLDGEACGDCDNCRRNQSRSRLAAAS